MASPGARRVTLAYACLAVAGVTWLLVTDDTTRGLLIAAVAQSAAAAILWVNVRRRTTVGEQGLHIVEGLRSRSIPWPEVERVSLNRARWGEEWLCIDLVDGSSITPPGVPVSVADELRAWSESSAA